MVSVNEATEIILKNIVKPRVESVSLNQAAGRVLAEKIVADRDFPPFNRVAMDGIAIVFNTFLKGQRQFSIQDIQAAGEPAKTLKDLTACIEIMTGAVLPEGTDTIIRYEDVEIKDKIASITINDVVKGQNIHSQGQDAKQQDVLLEPHILLSAAEIALLASVGKSMVDVFVFPKIAIVASGDELVDVQDTPALHQIRRSNSYALEAGIRLMGGTSTSFHLIDQKEILKNELQKIVDEHDVVILSGGISKGKFDFIPEVLEEIGITKLIQQVSQRPGKPFWFGVGNHKTVFALPGNPVSTYMCFYRYIKPWLIKSFGLSDQPMFAVLAADYKFQPKLTHFLQVKVRNEAGVLMAYPDAGGGSGDFANLKDVDGFLELPLERSEFKVGGVFSYYPFRSTL